MRFRTGVLVLFVLAVAVPPALAAGGERPANRRHVKRFVNVNRRKSAYDHPAPHGGELRTIGQFHLEWVAEDGGRRFIIYLTNMRDVPVSAAEVPADLFIKYTDGSKEHVWMDPVTKTAEELAGGGTDGPAASPPPSATTATKPDDPAAWAGKAYLVAEMKKKEGREFQKILLHITLGNMRYDMSFKKPPAATGTGAGSRHPGTGAGPKPAGGRGPGGRRRPACLSPGPSVSGDVP